MDLFKERRFGTFTFDAEHIRHNAQGIQMLMSGCIVVRAEHLFAPDVFEYTALHPDFEPVKEGQLPWAYDVLFTKHEDGRITYEFKRREP